MLHWWYMVDFWIDRFHRKASLTNGRRQKQRWPYWFNTQVYKYATPDEKIALSASQTLDQDKSNQMQANPILPSISTVDFAVLSSSVFAGAGCSASARKKEEMLWCLLHYTFTGHRCLWRQVIACVSCVYSLSCHVFSQISFVQYMSVHVRGGQAVA